MNPAEDEFGPRGGQLGGEEGSVGKVLDPDPGDRPAGAGGIGTADFPEEGGNKVSSLKGREGSGSGTGQVVDKRGGVPARRGEDGGRKPRGMQAIELGRLQAL